MHARRIPKCCVISVLYPSSLVGDQKCRSSASILRPHATLLDHSWSHNLSWEGEGYIYPFRCWGFMDSDKSYITTHETHTWCGLHYLLPPLSHWPQVTFALVHGVQAYSSLWCTLRLNGHMLRLVLAIMDVSAPLLTTWAAWLEGW